MKYIGRVILNMSELEFWRSTPREMMALVDVHCQINDPDKKEEPIIGIDQVL